MKAYSIDLRQKIVAAYDNGRGTQEQLAELFGVSRATVQNFLRRRRNTGSVAASPRGGGRRRCLDEKATALVGDLVRERADSTLEELCEVVEGQTGTRVSIATMWLVLRRMGLRLKKSHSTHPSVTPTE